MLRQRLSRLVLHDTSRGKEMNDRIASFMVYILRATTEESPLKMLLVALEYSVEY